MIEQCISLLGNLLSSLLPNLLKKEPSEHKKCYNEIRKEVAEVLSMYACCFYNPVDLADTCDHKLPPFYEEGSYKIRALASRLKALAETMPCKKTDVPNSIDELKTAAGYLFGISNSFHTPYGRGSSYNDSECIREWENELRRILNLDDTVKKVS